MRDNGHRPPDGEPWVWETRALLRSDAWRSAGINTRRFIEFLKIEHLNHGGQENGRLKAPHRQLVAFGISKDCVTQAICEAETLGLVDCHRGGLRVATTYALTWLPLHDGTLASNRWCRFRNLDLKPLPVSKIRNLPPKVGAGLPSKLGAAGVKMPKSAPKSRGRSGKNLPPKVGALSRSSYQDGSILTEVGGQAVPAAAPSFRRALP
jgi:hypothetical protein